MAAATSLPTVKQPAKVTLAPDFPSKFPLHANRQFCRQTSLHWEAMLVSTLSRTKLKENYSNEAFNSISFVSVCSSFLPQFRFWRD